MKKFDNIFEQAREIIRQQWTLQDLRREAQCTGRPEAVRQQIAAQIINENTNAERRTFYSFPTWQDAAATLLG